MRSSAMAFCMAFCIYFLWGISLMFEMVESKLRPVLPVVTVTFAFAFILLAKKVPETRNKSVDEIFNCFTDRECQKSRKDNLVMSDISTQA
jgi:hypothetical protein